MHIGIDLGTTNSLICVFQDGEPQLIKNSLGSFLTPSVVSIDGDTVMCGAAAKARLVSHPRDTVDLFKRTMGADKIYKIGKKKFNSAELSAIILTSLKRDAEKHLGHEISDVVISVPAYFNELQRKAVRAAGKMAGLNPKRLINEPTAAALAYGLQDLDAESNLLVYDLGGGTFDVSILEVFEGVMEVKATSGDAYLGGEDFTKALATHLESKLEGVKLSSDEKSAVLKIAEQAKQNLSSSHTAEISANIGKHELATTITRQDFETITTSILSRLRRPVERALYDSGLTIDEIDRVVLVGGATRMPIIRTIVAKQLRKLPDSKIDPDTVVAMGAGVQAALVGNDKALDDVVMTDVSAFTLGTETSQLIGKNYVPGFYHPIIERNSTVPISRETVISTIEVGQTQLEISVFQGEAPRVDSNIFLGKMMVKVPKNRKENEDVAIRFTYDVSGLLDVDVKILSTGETLNMVIKQLAGELSDADIAKTLNKLKGLKTHPRDEQENIFLTARIDQCYALARNDDRDQIQQMLVIFQTALEGQDKTEITRLREEISASLDAFEAGYVQ